MKNIGVFPGSFDPFTKGHEDIVQRILPFFDEVIIAVGINSSKKNLFSLESRLAHIQALFETEEKIRVETYAGLTTEYCKARKAGSLIRGIRNAVDSEYEKSIAQMNRDLSGIETLFLMTAPEYSAINSSVVREIKFNNGDIGSFVTKADLLIINK